MNDDALIAERHEALEGVLDERQRRLHAAVEAKVLGHGGVKRVHEATGVARGSILAGLKELRLGVEVEAGDGVRRVRRSGAGRTFTRWWFSMGQALYPAARELTITADGGGSNGSRVRLWKLELQHLADELGVPIRVSHFPPGTSKWNKIEHRLFSFITMNWRGKPLISHEVIVNLIAATTTRTGLKVRAQLDRNQYPKGVKVSDKEFGAIRLERDEFHGDWNYVIIPNNTE